MNHTPLPWTVKEEHQPEAYRICGPGGDKEVIAAICLSDEPAQEEANARYIVHCCNLYPRLVEALEVLLEAMHAQAQSPDEAAQQILTLREKVLPRPSKGDEPMSDTKEPRFPVGGPRAPVIEFFHEHGFIGSGWGDKHYIRADGLHAHLYNSGSRVRLSKDGAIIADGPLEETLLAHKIDTRPPAR